MLRVRGTALGLAVLPAAVAVVLWAGRLTGRMGAAGAPDAGAWGAARWAVTGIALLMLLAAGLFALRVRRVPPPAPLSAPIAERAAPELYRLVRELAERLEVPAPSRIALAPDCDSWLEDDATAGGPPALVIGSPFLWWMRVDELRALLAPVVAGGAATADREITAARRFVRGLDALALGRPDGALGGSAEGPAAPAPAAPAGSRLDRILARPARALLRRARQPAAALERAVAAGAAERAQLVDYGRRIAAQEQVGLAYAGWDRMLDRVALPAWRIGRSPERLNAGAVSALTELSRRDRLADGYESRLSERPACDLLEDPGEVDRRISDLAAGLFYGPPSELAPVSWEKYPEEVVARTWRTRAAVLLSALRALDAAAERRPAAGSGGLSGLSAQAGRHTGPADRADPTGPAGRTDHVDHVRRSAARSANAGSGGPVAADGASAGPGAPDSGEEPFEGPFAPAVGRVLDLLAGGRGELLVRSLPLPDGRAAGAGQAPTGQAPSRPLSPSASTSPPWSAAPPWRPERPAPDWTGWTDRCCWWTGCAGATWPRRSPGRWSTATPRRSAAGSPGRGYGPTRPSDRPEPRLPQPRRHQPRQLRGRSADQHIRCSTPGSRRASDSAYPAARGRLVRRATRVGSRERARGARTAWVPGRSTAGSPERSLTA